MADITKLDFNLEEMQNFQFKRVDLTNPNSILNYGSDVIDIINDIVDSLSKIMHDEDTSRVNFSEDIANINAFDDELQKLQTKNSKAQNNNFLEQLVNKIFEKLPIPSKNNQEQKIDTYADLYTKYCDDIDLLCKKMLEEQTNVKNTMNTNHELLKVLEVLLELLDRVIKTGEDDKNEYLIQLENLSSSISNEKKINIIKKLISTFERKLNDLREALAASEIYYYQLSEKDFSNMEILMQYDKFLKTTAPWLKLQSHNIIGTRQQSDRLNSIEQLSKSVNDIMKKNSATLNENIVKAQQLGSNGFIDVQTLMTLKKDTITAIESLKNYQSIMDKKRQENNKIVSAILYDLNEIGTKQNHLALACLDNLNEEDTEEDMEVIGYNEQGKVLKKKLGK